MHFIRLSLAFAAGVAIYNVCAMYLARLLGPLSISYLTSGSLTYYALAIGNVLFLALPVGLAVFILAAVSIILLRLPAKPAAIAMATGMTGAHIYIHTTTVLAVLAKPTNAWLPWAQLVKQQFIPPLWLLPSTVAPLVGLFLAFKLIRTRQARSEV